jgi:small redox-active disulfide protein 2
VKSVKVLGPGCKRCEATEQMVRAVAAKLGVDVQVGKVSDYAEIAGFGVVSTPGIVIDDKVVHSGGLPKTEDRRPRKVAGRLSLT